MEDCRVQIPVTATFSQVLNLYNERVIERKYHLFSESVQSVKYPIEPAFILDESHLNSANGQLNVIKEINVSNIGNHMQDPDFNLDHTQKSIHVIASLLSMKGACSKESMKVPPA